MGQNEDRELVPLKSDFDVTWRGYRRSQVQFYIQQTDTEIRMLTEDRDSALSQVSDLGEELEQTRAEIETLRKQLDDAAREPIDESALSDRLKRMVRLANDEAAEVRASAKAAAEHEWARSEQSAAELRQRYEALVNEADEWRQQAEQQRNEALAQTREDIERMSREAEQQRRKLDSDAEERRTQVEHDFEVSMAARREEEVRGIAEREQQSREAAQRRVREATLEAERRIRRANEHTETMLQVRQDLAGRVRSAQQMLSAAEPFLGTSEQGSDSGIADEYVARVVHNGVPPEVDLVSGADESGAADESSDEGESSESSEGDGVTVPKQREEAEEGVTVAAS